MLFNPIILFQTAVKQICLSSRIASPLPLQVCDSRFALFSTIRSCKSAIMASIEIGPELRKPCV
jgi:hypothetical protein